MAIITKPVEGILKNVPAIFTLNKSQVLALSIVSNDEYFYDSNNWKIIILKYESSEGKQQELVRFDATLESPTGFFFVSEKARDLFEIKSLKIVDFDGDILVIPRSELTTSDFDVEFGESFPSNLSYITPVSYTQNIQITNNIPSVTGTVTSYSISPALPAGLSLNTSTGVISGTPTVALSVTNFTVTASNSGGSATTQITISVVSAIPNVDYITYNLDGYTTSATKNAFGGVSGGVYTSNSDVAVKSSVDVASGDFDYEWKFDWSLATNISNMFVGVTGNNIVNGTSFYPNLTCLYGSSNNPDIATLWHNGQSGVTNLTLLNGDNYYRLIRKGSTIVHFFNGVQVYSASSTAFTAYPTVRTMGNEACKESYISVANEINAFNSAYISLPEPGKIVRLQPSINSNSNARFWMSEPLTGNFTFTATVKAGNVGESLVQALLGLNDIIPPATSPYGVKQGGWGFSFDASGNLNIWNTTTIQSWTKGSSYNIEIKRVSGVISYKVGSTTSTYTFNNSSTLYIAGTLQVGSWEVTNASLVLPEVPTINFVPVTWNVAGKTGVGTVTTGVNGLITKTTGGSSYNVNVLSNETITGDGYVEFINSSIFVNVVFGLAEINSSSGSYNQIIYGTYVAGLGAYERVLAGQATGGGIAASAYGDVIRIQRIGNTFSILKNGSVINTVTINNTNPLKASVSIYPSTSYGVNNVTISE
jgi:hypothetical protein